MLSQIPTHVGLDLGFIFGQWNVPRPNCLNRLLDRSPQASMIFEGPARLDIFNIKGCICFSKWAWSGPSFSLVRCICALLLISPYNCYQEKKEKKKTITIWTRPLGRSPVMINPIGKYTRSKGSDTWLKGLIKEFKDLKIRAGLFGSPFWVPTLESLSMATRFKTMF